MQSQVARHPGEKIAAHRLKRRRLAAAVDAGRRAKRRGGAIPWGRRCPAGGCGCQRWHLRHLGWQSPGGNRSGSGAAPRNQRTPRGGRPAKPAPRGRPSRSNRAAPRRGGQATWWRLAETELHSLDNRIAALELQLGDAAAHCQVEDRKPSPVAAALRAEETALTAAHAIQAALPARRDNIRTRQEYLDAAEPRPGRRTHLAGRT